MKIAKWDTFQGYRKTGPAWIKLHAGLIDKPEWMRLPVVARAVLPALWIAASRAGSDGELPDDIGLLSMLCHVAQDELSDALPSLVHSGFILCDKTVADLATERSQSQRQNVRERREEKRREDLPVQTLTSPTLDAGKAESASPARRDDVRVIEATEPKPNAVAEARAELVDAIKTAKDRRPELAGLSRQEILDRPEYHAPTGRVRLDSTNGGLLLATAAKLRGEVKARKATAPGWDLPPEDAEAKAKADSARAWIADHWPEDSDPTTWEDVLSLAQILEPPAEIAESVTAVLRFERYPDVYHRDHVAA